MIKNRIIIIGLIVGWFSLSCESGTEPLPTTQITEVKLTPELATTNYTSVFNVLVEDTFDMPFLYRWSLQHSGNTTQDTVTESGRFYWTAPPEPGNYVHSVRLVNEKEQELSEEFTFEVHVTVWEPPVTGAGLSGKIVFSAPVAYESPYDEVYHIFSMNVDGSDLKQLTDFEPPSANAYFPSWSPDGSKIVFTSSRYGAGHTPAMWTMYADGTNKEVLDFNDPFGLLGNYPKWSPDGNSILYDKYESGQTDVYTYNLSSGESLRLTSHQEDDGFPEWSPYGFRIAFKSTREYNSDNGSSEFEPNIYIMNSDGSQLKRVTSEFGSYVWTAPDKLLITYTDRNTLLKDIYTMNTESGVKKYIFKELDAFNPFWTFWNNRAQILNTVSRDDENTPLIIASYDLSGSLIEKIELNHELFKEAIGFDWYIGDE